MNQTENQSRIDEAERFFNLLFGSVTVKKFSYLWTRPDKKTYPFDVSIPENRRAMAIKAIELSDKGWDVYFGVNLTDNPPANGKRAKKADITLQIALVTDIDTLGGKHTDTNKYPPDFETAKSLLPFDVSSTANSGYGLHGYCLFSEPLAIDDTNRDFATARNKNFIEVIRAHAGKFASAVDAVQDLSRVLRVPGTRNYKAGVSDDAPICHIVDVNDCRFDPADIDQKLSALLPVVETKSTPARTTEKLSPSSPARTTAEKSLPAQIDSPEFDDFRVRRMLDVLPVGYLHGNDWLVAMTAIKNLGFTYAEFDAMNQGGENYNETENKSRWDSVTENVIGIGALYNLAKQFNYDAKAVYHEWLDLHPELRPSRDKRLPDDMKRELDDAIIWLKSLSPETFTVDDARDEKNLRSVALALHFGFHYDAENFFDTIDTAKKLAKNRLKEDDSDLTKKLTHEERLKLSALADGVSISELRRRVEKKAQGAQREVNRFDAELIAQKANEEAKKRRQAYLEKLERNKNDLEQLLKMPESPERNAKIIPLIRETCEWNLTKAGHRVSVKATNENIERIFALDPNINGLVGFDDFLQADVFLKPPIWAPNKKRGTEWQDRDDAHLRSYLRANYKEFSARDLIFDTVTVHSDANKFHDVQDYFKSLPKWDGKPRAETLYIDWLKVPDTPYSREVTIKHLIGAVARIFHAGCQFYWALVLRGNQKIGKSYIPQRLGGKWYKSISDRVDDPHAVDTLRLVWIGEFKEMSGMRKADINAIKDFIELSADTRRLAYARRAGTYPRHCVFVITVNDNEFLSDVTGNRRFLILDSPLPKFGYVKEVRGEKLSDDNVIAQIWAEVYHRYNELFKDGFDERKLELSAETELKGEEIAETYMRDDGLTTEIKGYLDTQILPPVLWQLLTRDERRDFIKSGRLVMLDALAEFNHRRRARGGNRDTVQADVDFISDWLEGTNGKNFVRSERKTIQGRDVIEYILYGSELRQHICAAEIFNECFGSDNRKRMPRINEILAHLDEWHLGARLRNADPAYPDQTKPYYRD